MIGKILAALCGAGILVSWRLLSPQWHVFQALVFGLFLLAVVGWMRARVALQWSWFFLPVVLIAAWPGAQLLLGATVYPYATSTEWLRWSTYAAVFVLAFTFFRKPREIEWLLRVTIVYSLLLAGVSTMQHFAGNGLIFWIWDAGGVADMGPFLNRDHYSAFMVLIVPLALWQAFADPERRYLYILATAAIYASVIAGASRAGAFLVTAEVLFCLFLVNTKNADEESAWRRFGPVLATLVVIAALVGVVGWDQLLERYQMDNPYAGRREFALSSLEMIRERPLGGFGMGTWTTVYPAYATVDFGKYVNAAHNDWLQWACDGGLPLLVVFLALFSMSIAICWRVPWAIGVPAVFLHCIVEFPFGDGRYLPAVFFLLFGAAAGVAAELKGRGRGFRAYTIQSRR